MGLPKRACSEATIVDRALAALATPGGETRVKRHLAAVTPAGAPQIEMDDLLRALEELRRRVLEESSG